MQTDLTALIERVESGTNLPSAIRQRADWRVHSTVWLVERIPEADRETALAMIQAIFDTSEADGFDHARNLVRDIATGVPGDRTAQVIAASLDELHKRNYAAAIRAIQESRNDR